MDWEGDPDAPPPRRRVTGVVVLVAMVAVIGWLARSPATTPDPSPTDDPDVLAVEEATEPPTDPTDAPIEGLFGLDQILAVRQGTWEEVALPPALGQQPTPTQSPTPTDAPTDDRFVGTATDPPAAAWHGAELVVIDGTVVAAHDPVTRSWRELPEAPGQADSHREMVDLGQMGLLMLEHIDATPSEPMRMWLLDRDETWYPIADPPTTWVSGVTAIQSQLVIAGADPSRAASEIWRLARETQSWEPLPAIPVPLRRAQPFDTTAGLVVLGHVPEGSERGRLVPVAWLWSEEEQTWQRLAEPPAHGQPATQPVMGMAVAAPAIGMAGSSKDQIVLLSGQNKRNLALSIYDVRSDRWEERPLDVPPAFAAALDLPAFTAMWDGQRTVWFQPMSGAPVLLSHDLPTSVMSVLATPRDVAYPRVVPHAGGLFLVGADLPFPGEVTSGPGIQHWTADDITPDPTPEPVPQPAVPVSEGDMLGLDEVLPVVEGTWQELVPPEGGEAPSPYRLSLWDGTEVIVVDTVSPQAYDAARDTWRSVPNLPSDELEQGGLQGVVVEGTVVVADTVAVGPVPEEVGRSDAWALVADRWQPVTSVPDAVELIGAADGQIISARYTTSDATHQAQLWLSDPTSSEPVELLSPTPMQPTQVIDTPDGFVVLGTQEVGGSGSYDDPFVFEAVGLHWVGATWEPLDLPDMDVWGAAAVWVPVPPGRAQDPDPAGGLVIVGGRHDELGVTGVAYDLATGDWTSIDVPATEPEDALLDTTLAATWDGADTVWVYGGYRSAIHLALDLPTGQLRVAEPTGGRVWADLHWDGEGLLLLGGFGPSGPVSPVERWTPADR